MWTHDHEVNGLQSSGRRRSTMNEAHFCLLGTRSIPRASFSALGGVVLIRGYKLKPCMSTSAPSGLNGPPRTVWTGVAHLQRLRSVSVKRLTRSRVCFLTVSTQMSDR
eukprot:2635739-Prymnesium_polylepis.1